MAPLETLEEVAFFRAREEALEVRARRRLLEEQRRLARQHWSRGQVEIGHRRLALIERAVLFVIAVIAAVLAALGTVSLTAALLAGAVFGGLRFAAWRGNKS